MDITVVIPTHPARMRNGMTQRAVGSVFEQSLPASGLIVEVDTHGEGAAPTRHRGLQKVTTPWVAFLDSDDQFKPNHLEVLTKGAEELKADYAYSWYDAVGFGSDPLPHFGKPFDPDNPSHTTITVLVRTELAQEVGFLTYNSYTEEVHSGEDWYFTLGCVAAGARIVHIPQRTWMYNYHGKNTSGLPVRGDAR
jgi:glycosyltransferase involved in cell wall biosynthesis